MSAQVETTRSLLQLYLDKHPAMSIEDGTEYLIGAARKDPRLLDELRPGIRHQVALELRGLVRRLEHEFGDLEAVDALSDRRNLMASGFWTPHGRVLWGTATLADHRERIDWLNSLIQGTERTIGLHQRAIETIEAAGVRCLDDLAQGEPATSTTPIKLSARPAPNSARRADRSPKPERRAPVAAGAS